ncbi:hypothetical protein MMC28_001335 [Mycoblastus sanguinarius]|nr:hypothetical protein [Mycoblastus sanguinarius]
MIKVQVFRWVLDVQVLWPNPMGESERAQSTAQWAEGTDVQRALDLLTSDERARVLRFHFPRDAKLSLGSNLLKHLAIAKTCGIPWSQAVIGADSNRKPCFHPTDSTAATLEFNVSHHGDLVALVGCAGDATKLGVDVVKMNWEKDYSMVMKEGFEAWANVYEMVFSDREIQDIAGYTPPTQSDPQKEIKAKLRHFYAHWCLKEAYVKMTGEALLASWLKDLEFRNVQVPMPVSQLQQGQKTSGEWGQTCGDVGIWFQGKRVTDVKLEIRAFREEYMIATASSHVDASLSAFEQLDIERDLYTWTAVT